MLSATRLVQFRAKNLCVPAASRYFSSPSKYEIPSMEEYHKLFDKSNIMEKLLPRKLESGEEIERNFPSLLKESASGS